MLCVLAELATGVAAMLGMVRRHDLRDWHTQPVAENLPLAKPDTVQKEITDDATGFMLSLSRHEAVLTVSHPKHGARFENAGQITLRSRRRRRLEGSGTRCNAAPPVGTTSWAFGASAGQEPCGPISRDHASLI